MSEWVKAKKILCIRLDAMGDLLMTTPALSFLKAVVPDRELTLLTSHEGAQIAPYTELFQQVITYGAPWLKASAHKKNVDDDFEMIERLRKHNFDGAIIFTVYSQNPLPAALMCYLAGIPLVASFCRENPYGLLSHWLKEEEPLPLLRHEVRRHLDLVGELHQVQVPDSPLVLKSKVYEKKDLFSKLAEKGVEDFSHLVVIHPGSTASSRRFHTRGFARVAEQLLASQKKIIFTGAASEEAIVREIISQMDSTAGLVDLSGQLTLGEFIALIELTPVLLSNNSGPVHMASALGTPVVDIYALTNPQHTPWMVKHSLLYHPVSCAYCYKSVCPLSHNNCINLIAPEHIVKETLSLSVLKSSALDHLAVHPLQLEENYDNS